MGRGLVDDSAVGWSYQQALSQIQETEDGKPQRMNVADLIAAKRRNKTPKKVEPKPASDDDDDDEDDDDDDDESAAMEDEDEAEQSHAKM